MSTPIYTSVDSVKVRLANKVQFQRDATNAIEGELPNDFLCQLISDSETEVEQDLRHRYAIPFRSLRTGKYADLPDHTKRAIRMVVDLRATQMILETDFGRGTHVDGKSYAKTQEDNYQKYINKLLGRDSEGKNDKIDRFRFSGPLEDLLLAVTNKEADDGYRGTIINTDASCNDSASYAARQVNNPSESYPRVRRGVW